MLQNADNIALRNLHFSVISRLQSWALFAEISGAESLGEIGAGA
jgi:hypothetical protein